MKPLDHILLFCAGLCACAVAYLLSVPDAEFLYGGGALPAPMFAEDPAPDPNILAALPWVGEGTFRQEWAVVPDGKQPGAANGKVVPPANLPPKTARATSGWDSIVIRPSGRDGDSVASLSAMNRDLFGKPALPFHFVIGNGRGMADGSVETGKHWKSQTLARPAPQTGGRPIEICLVGDLSRHGLTVRQKEALAHLVATLRTSYGIPTERVAYERTAGGIAAAQPSPRVAGR